MFEFIKKLLGLKKVEQLEVEVAAVEEKAKKVVKRVKKVADVNNDGKVNVEDVKEVKKRVSKKVKELADVDKDGDVDLTDVKEAVKKVSKKAKKVIEPVIEEIAPKKRGRKPKA
jgi:Ca2+-binding EF-hand superfamily protein